MIQNRIVNWFKKIKCYRFLQKVNYFVKNIYYLLDYFLTSQIEIKPNGILLFTNNLERQGAQTLLFNITKNLVAQGLNVCVISPFAGPFLNDFIGIASIRIVPGFYLKFFLKKMAKKYNYNKAICNTIVTAEAIPYLKQFNYKIVFLIHEMSNAIKSLGLINKATTISSLADFVVFPSTFVYKSFCECCKARTINYKIKNQGLFNNSLKDIDLLNSKKIIKNKYNIEQDTFIITNVASVSLRKGFDLFLDIVYLALKSNCNYKFIWVGDKYETILADKLKQYNLNNFPNLILPGFISDFKELNNFYSASDVFLLTSREDPFPNVVLDALVSRTPIVAFKDCGGFQDVVKNGETGYLVNPFNINEVLEKIELILSDKDKYIAMQDYCYNEGIKHNFDSYCSFLLELLGKRGS